MKGQKERGGREMEGGRERGRKRRERGGREMEGGKKRGGEGRE